MTNYKQLLFSIKSRLSYSTLQNIVETLGGSGARGMEATIDKLENDFETEFDALFYNNLYNNYLEHVLCGDKYVFFYKLNAATFDYCYNFFKDFEIKSSVFSANFPFVLSEVEILQVPEDTIFISNIYEHENLLYLTINTIRSIEDKIELDRQSIQVSDSDNFTKFFGVKKLKKQFFDVIVLNKLHSTIEYRMDYLTGYQTGMWFQQIKKFFTNICPNNIEINTELNLFSILLKIYQDKSGQICELKFTTDDDIIKGLKSRLNREDIREDKYHLAGSVAVPQINPYRIGIMWDIDSYKTELLVPGTLKLLNSVSPMINEVIISRCRNITDYNFIINKIFSYLISHDIQK